jgi:hypothetical protein
MVIQVRKQQLYDHSPALPYPAALPFAYAAPRINTEQYCLACADRPKVTLRSGVADDSSQ